MLLQRSPLTLLALTEALRDTTAPATFSGGVLYVRGTRRARDLLTEARMGKRPFAGAGVHRGFHDMYAGSVDELLGALEGARPRLIVGHSLGGVLGVMLAHDLEAAGRAPRQVVTVGAPRMGDDAFARLERPWPVHRVYNAEDVVTRLPPLCRHVGRPMKLRFDAGSILDNHSLERYADALRSHADESSFFLRAEE